MRTAALTLFLLALALTMRHPLAIAAQAGQETAGNGVLQMDAPMYLLPDPTRTPLATLPTGTSVRVLGRERDWFRIVYRDSVLGERTGYVRADAIRVEAAPPRTPAAPRPGAPAAAQAPRPRPAAARARSSWIDRGYLSLNAAYLATSNGFTATTTFTQNVEAATVTTTFDAARPPVVDVGGAVRIWRDLAIGASATWLTKERSGSVSANLPHPFLFNMPRTVTGSVSDVPREEIALHVDAAWIVPISPRVETVVFGGPSYFHLTQGLVTDVAAASSYPFDTATFVSAAVTRTSKSRIGYNAGVDVMVRGSRHVGVGGLVRYSRASVPLPAGDGTELSVRAGGLEVGGGLRVRF